MTKAPTRTRVRGTREPGPKGPRRRPLNPSLSAKRIAYYTAIEVAAALRKLGV